MHDRQRLRPDQGRVWPGNRNRRFLAQLEQKERSIAAQIRADPKGPVSCAPWADDPYANASVRCNQDAHWCQVMWPLDQIPRLKQNE